MLPSLCYQLSVLCQMMASLHGTSRLLFQHFPSMINRKGQAAKGGDCWGVFEQKNLALHMHRATFV